MKGNKPLLIVVAGPTASGKTALSVEIARLLGTEILSADSRQFYKEMPIGTAAPGPDYLQRVKHHFVGHLSVRDSYNVSMFEKDALALLDKLFVTRPAVVMTGGSGLYINAVCKGIDDLPDPDEELRRQLNEEYQKAGIGRLQQRLKELDPEYYAIVDRQNPKRLLRAIEVCMQTGQKYSALRKGKPAERPFDCLKIGLELPRALLYERINRRTEKMMKKGWLQEAERLLKYRNLNALNTVGYKELFQYLDGSCTLDEAVEKIKVNTRRYAKRQITWFKRDKEIHWFPPDAFESVTELIRSRITD